MVMFGQMKDRSTCTLLLMLHNKTRARVSKQSVFDTASRYLPPKFQSKD